MPVTKQRTLDYLEQEWGTYVERFQRLPEEEQRKRVNTMGYASLRDLLAHVLAWWEEGMGIINAIAEGRAFERKRYDFDAFNAEAVAKYGTWEETAFMAHFEQARQETAARLGSMEEAVFENRRVQAWLDGIVFQHAREHLLSAGRFLLLDILSQQWATYPADFERLEPDRKRQFLAEQGFESFHDLLAHIVGWWEQGQRVIGGLLNDPGFQQTELDTDTYNRELVRKYSSWPDPDLFAHYNTVRLALIDLIAGLPESAFQHRDIERWLAEDVVEHYNEHALPR